ncbi:MAG: hypothetical protein IJQ31_10735 [Thermoguttaceae bacterium]|nr:hypothetical protein [Thermoguttaceae bacterium]
MTCLVILVFLLILTLIFWRSFGWHFYEKGPTRNGEKMCQITAQKIRLIHRLDDGTLSSEVPSWIHENIFGTVYNKLLLNQSNLSIYDEELNENVRRTLKEVYWIQKVNSIRKFYPPFLEIEVTYRRPAMLVSVSSDSFPGGNSNESARHFYYVPLSSDCCILPMNEEDFPVPTEELDEFPTFCGEAPEEFYDSEDPLDITAFSGCQPPISQTPGNLWSNDAQIRDAVKIVNLLGDRWKKFGLDYLCIENNINDPSSLYAEKQFCLVTKNGSRIHWGRCMEEASNKGDVLDVDKVAQLDEMYEANGCLDTPEEPFNITFHKQTNHEKTQR